MKQNYWEPGYDPLPHDLTALRQVARAAKRMEAASFQEEITKALTGIDELVVIPVTTSSLRGS